jgi:hypothetical protein
MAQNPHFLQALDRMRDVHDRKNNDYAADDNPYSNFEGVAQLTGLSVEQVFFTLIGIKAERLKQLLSGKEVNFESKEDSVLDLAVYAALWLSWLDKQGMTVEGANSTITFIPEGSTLLDLAEKRFE